MQTRTCVLLLVANLLVSGVVAQGRQPRFVLPARAYDYTASPDLASVHPHALSLPAGSDPLSMNANELGTLGRVLFYDRLLSRNQTRSCASCHQQSRAFADSRAKSTGFAGAATKRNTMSLVDLRLRTQDFFWDGRAKALQDAVVEPIQNPIEMGMNLDTLVGLLDKEPGYADLFQRAFGDPRATKARIALALAQFVRAIASSTSKYDEGLAVAQTPDKDFANFSASENRGKRIFFGDGGSLRHSCAACHVHRVPTMCGSCFIVAPSDFQSDQCRNNGLDNGRKRDDPGMGGVTAKASDQGKFRAPSLRNIELTAPYMHDGRFATLDEVLRFYSTGMKLHPAIDPVLDPKQRRASGEGWGSPSTPMGPPTAQLVVSDAPGFQFSRQDREDLVAFLHTLTDSQLIRDARFADPFVR